MGFSNLTFSYETLFLDTGTVTGDRFAIHGPGHVFQHKSIPQTELDMRVLEQRLDTKFRASMSLLQQLHTLKWVTIVLLLLYDHISPGTTLICAGIFVLQWLL